MSGTRVNLLPREAEEREAGRRAMAGLVVAGLLFLAVLAGLFFFQNSRVNDAKDRLETARAERDEAQAEVRELQAYADLEDRRDLMTEVVQTTMSAEASIAGVLQDVAAVMPNEAALTSLTVSILPAPEEGEEFDFGGPAYGRILGQGETLRGHAPGVERFILELDKIAAFFNIFVSSSTLETGENVPIDITTYSFEAELGPEVFTGRYLDGLPEALR